MESCSTSYGPCVDFSEVVQAGKMRDFLTGRTRTKIPSYIQASILASGGEFAEDLQDPDPGCEDVRHHSASNIINLDTPPPPAYYGDSP